MNDSAAQLAQVNRLLQQRSYQEAIRILTRLLELEPSHRDALYNLAGTYALLRKPEQAKIYLDRLLPLMPSSSELHASAASNALAMNQADLAVELGRKAVNLAPQSAAARLILADALEAFGQFLQAKLEYLVVLERDPRNVRVTDKMPFNFLHLGLVAALCPEARIIHCRRDPLDTCTSCHFTTFNNNLQFASELRVLGRCYLDYRRLMDHWKAVLTIPMLEVDYESLVSDPEPMIRRLVEFCGVDWEPGCAQFHETERGIQTPSRWQVRQPVYRHAVGRWRHDEKLLAPLLDILSPALVSSAGQPADRA